MPRLILTRPQRESISEIIALYAAAGGRFLPLPDGDQLDDAIEQGRVFTMSSDNGHILASAAIFKIGNGTHDNGATVVPIFELSGMVRDNRVGGLKPYSSQQLLLAVRILEMASSSPLDGCIMSSVIKGNKKSLDNLLKAGLTRCSVQPPWTDLLRRAWTRDEAVAVENLLTGSDAVVTSAAILASAIQDGLHRFEGDMIISYSLELQFDGIFGAFLEKLPNLPKIAWENDLPPKRALLKEPHHPF